MKKNINPMSKRQFVLMILFACVVIAAAIVVKKLTDNHDMRTDKTESKREYEKPYIIIKKDMTGHDSMMARDFCLYTYRDASGEIHTTADSCTRYSLGDTIK